jgi:hypothetical protein
MCLAGLLWDGRPIAIDGKSLPRDMASSGCSKVGTPWYKWREQPDALCS